MSRLAILSTTYRYSNQSSDKTSIFDSSRFSPEEILICESVAPNPRNNTEMISALTKPTKNNCKNTATGSRQIRIFTCSPAMGKASTGHEGMEIWDNNRRRECVCVEYASGTCLYEMSKHCSLVSKRGSMSLVCYFAMKPRRHIRGRTFQYRTIHHRTIHHRTIDHRGQFTSNNHLVNCFTLISLSVLP